MHDRQYAVKRVDRLKAQLNSIAGLHPTPTITKQRNSHKEALRRWLRLYPDIDPDFLKSITRRG
jgi:hypothetical protein